MTTLLFGSQRDEKDTLQMPTYAPASRVPAGGDQVALADHEVMPQLQEPMHLSNETQRTSIESSSPRVPMPIMKRPFPALPAMTAGLVSTAAVWLGLALFVAAVAYPMSDLARATLTLIGSSLVAMVLAFALSSRPEYA